MQPILYSFRRCPYAIRARLAVASAGVTVELREVVLRDKAPEFLAASPSATVPCLVAGHTVIDESLDVMKWALERSDPEALLNMPEEGWALIETTDGPFKAALDRYKYHTRHADVDPEHERGKASAFLAELETHLDARDWLFGNRPTIADLAILPFVRQFAFVDKSWFDTQPWPNLSAWLERFIASDRFRAVFQKYPKWETGDEVTLFP